MVLSGVNLANHPANAWPVSAKDNKQIFRDEPNLLVHLNDLDMGEPLAICADFVLAFYNENATTF